MQLLLKEYSNIPRLGYDKLIHWRTDKLSARNAIITITGFICLGLGSIGVFLPIMPTTPFILLAALCFSSANKKIYGWLQQSSFFGQFIDNYRTRQGIKKSHKISSIVFLWAGLFISMVKVQILWVCLILTIVGVCVTVHLLLIKTKN